MDARHTVCFVRFSSAGGDRDLALVATNRSPMYAPDDERNASEGHVRHAASNLATPCTLG